TFRRRRRNARPGRTFVDLFRRADARVPRRHPQGDDHASDRQGLYGPADRRSRRLLRPSAKEREMSHDLVKSDAAGVQAGRRRFNRAVGSALALGGVGGALSLAGCAAPGPIGGKPQGRVLVVGGGYGGATAAKYLKKWGGDAIEVVLVERQPAFISCPLSNLVLGGSRRIEDLTVPYSGLRRAGIRVVQDEVVAI